MNNSPIKIFLLAIRPKTLPAAIAPVMLGTAMAIGDGVHHFPTALAALLGALLIQIGTNLANDYFDFKKGADTADRAGPVRVTQAGLVTPQRMMTWIAIIFVLAIWVCFWLIQRAGWPIAAIGGVSILCGILYTAGPWPLGYLGLGEILVIIFFGMVAVAGTYYAQSLEMNLAIILAGLGPGFFSAAILVINNIRDIETDRQCNKKTLAVRFGRSFALSEYLFFILAGSLIPVLVYGLMEDHIFILAATLVSLLAIPVIKVVLTTSAGPPLNHALSDTGKLLLIYSIIFSLGWLL